MLDTRVDTFTRNVKATSQRFDALKSQAEDPSIGSGDVLQQALAEMQATVEELQIAEEELRQQNDELVFARELLEEERLRYRDLFEFAPDGYVLTDSQGLIQDVNRAACALLHSRRDVLVGKSFASLINAADRRHFRERLQAALTSREPQAWDCRLGARRHQTFSAWLRFAAVHDWRGKTTGVRWLVRDMSERLAAEEQVRALNAQLEKRVLQRTAELETLSSLKEELLVREQDARAAMTAAHQRQAFLAQAGALLASSLDYNTTLTSVARLAVPTLADWCAVDILEEDGSISRVTVVHADRSKARLAEELRQYPPLPGADSGVAEALRTGQPVFYASPAEWENLSLIQNDRHREILRQLGSHEILCVPLMARGQVFGAISLALSNATRSYDLQDLALAEELASRAAVAVDNARLYRAAQREIEVRKQAEIVLARNQEHIQALNERLQRAMTETHHRVKNSLQIIAAMVDMRLMEGAEHLPAEEVQRLGRHIRTLAVIHEILTKEAKDEGQVYLVSCKAVLEKLLPVLQQSAERRNIHFQADDFSLPAKAGTSLALVVNELVSNSLKHGAKQVDVCLSVRDDAAILEVSDDGPGFPAEFDPAVNAHTGLDLVENLSRWDLAGRTRYENRPEGGAVVCIEIPVPSQAASP